MSAVYGLYSGSRDMHGAENVLYNMFSHSGWGIAVVILLYACHHGYGGLINLLFFYAILDTFEQADVHGIPGVLLIIIVSERDTMYYTDVKITVYLVVI